MKFTVKRSEWYRGNGNALDSKPVVHNESQLLREDGKKCCIGFVGLQCGFSEADLLGHGTITVVREDGPGVWPKWMLREEWVGGHKEYKIQKAYITNDSSDLTDEQREKRLQYIFAENGDEIVFVD